MKKLIIILLFSTTVFAQNTYQKNFDNNHILISEGWLKHNQKVDYWHFYYPNGNVKKEGHFQKNIETKYWRFFTSTGRLEKEGHFKNGLKNDWWLFYDTMEKINHKCQLKDNQKNGYCLMYENEKLIAASKYKEGKKLKEWTTFASFKSENKLSDLQ